MKHRQERILRVFVAAPSDVTREVKVLRKVVEKLNQEHGDHLGVRIELLNWKTNIIPGLGPDAQTVINEQIGDDYDVFVGILWTRFGTATPRARSGTEEEYKRAVERWQQDHQTQVMIYFSDMSARPSEVSPDQLAKVQNFRKKIAESTTNATALYCEFKKQETFRDLAGRHLAALMHKRSEKPVLRRIPAAKIADKETVSITLKEKKVPFVGLQDADFFVRKLTARAKGFQISVSVPEEPYWRVGFALSSDDYIQPGRSDIEITRDFLFHIGRGEPSDPKKRTDLHWQMYSERKPCSVPVLFSSGKKISLSIMFSQRRDALNICFAGQRLDVKINPNYCRYLYVLAWADWFDDFNVPVILKMLP